MRIVYAVSLAFLSICSCFFLWSVRKEQGITKYIRRVLVFSVIGMISGIVTSFSQSEKLSLVCYGIYFAAQIWILAFFTEFTLVYTGNTPRAFRVMLLVAAGAATLNCILNVKFQQAFSVRELIWVTDGNRYLILNAHFWFKVQVALAYVMGVICILALLAKSIETPPAYRIRYLSVLFMIIVAVSINMAFMYFSLPMDWSLLFYAMFSIVTWFFATRYIRTFLLSKTLSVIVDEMDTGLVIFDYAGNCVHMNDRAKAMLDRNMNDVSVLLKEWYNTSNVTLLRQHTQEHKVAKNGQKLTYRIGFEELRDSNGTCNGSFISLKDVSAELAKKEEDKYNETHDHLTNLLNAEAFVEESRNILEENPSDRYVMIITDPEAFDSIAEIYGREMRSGVIAGLGGLIWKKCLAAHGVGGRLKGDGFALLLPEDQYSEKTMNEEIFAMMEEIIGTGAGNFRLRIGVCQVFDRGCSVRTLMDRARTALNYLRDDDPSTVSWYTEGMRQKGIADNSLSGALPMAIRNNELKMYLQAILDKDDRMIGAEALVRWHKDGKILMPGEFLPLFEHNEQIVEVDQFIWVQAFKQLKKWKDEGHKNLFITVNIARRDLYLLDICSEMIKLARKYDVEPKNLHIDISVSVLFMEGRKLSETIRRLTEAGFYTDLDDFGGPYTSPMLLKHVHFDGIKICRELITGIETDPANKSVTKCMVEMGRSMNMNVYSEGIETEREYKSLKAMGCDCYQGFFISEPVSIEEFEQSYFS